MKRTPALLAIALLLLGIAFAREIPLTPGSVDPAAQGKLNVKRQSDGTQQVKVDAEHPALTPSEMGYVVWIQPPGHPPENHGVLKIDQNQKGSFQTTAYPRYDVFVTAENDLHATQPSGPEVLRATVGPE